ncbi:T9SS type A sorting domain-containing protein [Crocinitomicaceae bacterium]|nr:T9SS type A sorting domain-containing protein [Crocinitomicaceae bacterium]
MKKELQERLSQYTAAAAAVTIGAAGANAQIVYTDVDPDFMHPGDEVGLGLDMNNDGNFDFIIASGDSVFVTSNGSFRVRNTLVAGYGTQAAANAIAGETPSNYNYALALNMNDMIDNTLNWIAATNTMAYNVNSANPYNENWNGVTDRYLGLRFNSGGNDYYGWARMDVQAEADVWTLKDYAYQAGQTGIEAGATATIEEGTMDQYVHFVNQSNNTVMVRFNEAITGANVTVVSASGQIVQVGAVDGTEFVVDMNGLAGGIYMINVTSEQGSITKKMSVAN